MVKITCTDFRAVVGEPQHKNDCEVIKDCVLGTAVAIALLVPGILGLRGALDLSYGGAVTLTVLGALTTFGVLTQLPSGLASCKNLHRAIQNHHRYN